MFILPEDPAERKKWPVGTFLRGYFPDAIAYLAHLSWVANEQHNPGEPMHWARDKSGDQEDTMMRHFLEGGTVDSDGLLHTAKAAWRNLAMLQLELEKKHENENVEDAPPVFVKCTMHGKRDTPFDLAPANPFLCDVCGVGDCFGCFICARHHHFSCCPEQPPCRRCGGAHDISACPTYGGSSA